MTFDKFKKAIEIIPVNEAQKLRQLYINTFINVDKEYYKKYIEIRYNYSDGLCYTGYLWDCLKVVSVIDMESIKETASMLNEVFVFWDVHTKENIFTEDYWKFGKEDVLRLDLELLIMNIQYLPEDIYIFNEDLTWTLILTHEYVDGKRWCLKSGNI